MNRARSKPAREVGFPVKYRDNKTAGIVGNPTRVRGVKRGERSRELLRKWGEIAAENDLTELMDFLDWCDNVEFGYDGTNGD